MKTTDDSALKDFHEVLKKHSLSKNDFELSEQDLTVYDPNQIVPIKGKITVKHKTTGKKCTYDSGNNTH